TFVVGPGTCRSSCGAAGQQCCSGSYCGASLVCGSSGFTTVCSPCGAAGQPCCYNAGTQTCNGGLTCCGLCVDISNDGNNCGACGTSCGGNACSGGCCDGAGASCNICGGIQSCSGVCPTMPPDVQFATYTDGACCGTLGGQDKYVYQGACPDGQLRGRCYVTDFESSDFLCDTGAPPPPPRFVCGADCGASWASDDPHDCTCKMHFASKAGVSVHCSAAVTYQPCN